MSAHHLLPRFNAWTLTYILLITGIITLGANHDHTDIGGAKYEMKPKIPFGDSWYVEGSWDLRVYYYLQHPPVTIATRRPKGE